LHLEDISEIVPGNFSMCDLAWNQWTPWRHTELWAEDVGWNCVSTAVTSK